MRLSLDINILVYAAAIDAGEQRQRAVEILARSAFADCVLTLQSLGEFAHLAVRKQIAEHSDVAARVRDWLDLFNTAAPEPAAVRLALEFHEIGRLSWWDALFVSTAASAGCTLLLSEDMQDGVEHAGVTIRNPFVGPAMPEDIEALFIQDNLIKR